MIELNTSAILLGVAVGLPMSVLFFWGLNWGMRVALASTNPGSLLMLSFFVRLVVLLAVGFALSKLSGTLWSLAGYMLAFLLVRVLAVLRARIRQTPDLAKQEGI